MFVLNDMRFDSRVRREATTLAAAGYQVTVHAVMSDATSQLASESVDGYHIVRSPMLMRPAKLPGPASPPRVSLRRRALAASFLATRPLFGGTLHWTANWRLRWHTWARSVERQVMPAAVWHAHDFNTLGLAIACAERHGGSVVYDSHEIFTEAGAASALPKAMRTLIQHRERSWARRAAAVITVNDSLAEVLQSTLGLDDIRVVRNCAQQPAGPSPIREQLRIGSGPPLVLYHGSLTCGRGLEALIVALEDPRLRGTHLAFMGYGPLRPRLEQLAAASPAAARIQFLPPVSPDAVTTWVAGADVAAMPIEADTLNHRLSSPNKLFEAVAAGVPVVGPDFAEFRRVVHDPRGHLGRLHPDHKPASIAGAIHSVLTLPRAEQEALRARCRAAAVERWNWDYEAARLLATYERLAPAASALQAASHRAIRVSFAERPEVEHQSATR